MANPWFRMYAEFATDPKVQSMSEAMQRRLMMVLCMRCSDVLATLHVDELAFALRISDDELAETKALFVRKGFIDDQWNVLNWAKRQFTSDSSTERSRKHRAAKKTGNDAATLHDVAATPPDTDTDTEREEGENPAVAGPSQQPDACPHQAIIDLYHEALPAARRIRDWTPARQAALRARWRERPDRQNIEWWREFFGYVAKSDFLCGKVSSPGRKPFELSLDWLCKSENFVKVLEGAYEA